MEDNRVMDIYENLLAFFGPQGWWPGETTLEIMVGAVLTQSVAWSNVEKAISRLKEAGRLNEEYIINAPLEELGEYIRSTLYYRQKAKKLKALFSWLKDECDFDYEALFSRPVDKLREQMLALWGMGEETVDSILCYAGGLPVMVVDAYTRRIFARQGLVELKVSYQEMQEFIVAHLPASVQVYNEFHALLVRLGKDYCRAKKPRCQVCPVSKGCHYGEKEILLVWQESRPKIKKV